MTQILTRANLDYVLQVSDRLVTRDGIPFDPISNKSLLVAATNGVITLSYTGHAFLGGVPADRSRILDAGIASLSRLASQDGSGLETSMSGRLPGR